jgi:hypothetical protein
LAAMLGISVCVWLYVKLMVSFEDWFERRFSFSFRRDRAPKVEIQTLFHGNTKDDKDQI